jgi:predicted nuclease with TOPRIM domain
MEAMKLRYDEIRSKVEKTRRTLNEAANRMSRHEELKATIAMLKAKTERAIVEKARNDEMMVKVAAAGGKDYAQAVQALQVCDKS